MAADDGDDHAWSPRRPLSRDAPRYRILPPLAFALPLALGLLLELAYRVPLPIDDLARRVAIALATLGALAMGGSAMLALRRARTPWEPTLTTTAIVTRGPYALTRNPLYVTLALVYAAIALAFDSSWAVLLLPLALALVTWGAILPEERYLAAKFGDEYAAYRAKVRRWV